MEWFHTDGWAIQDSMINLLIHENENVPEKNLSLMAAKQTAFEF
jgi:hypothetical protein